MGIILYSTGCPKCKVLKRKLESKGIEYIENNNIDEMLQLGFNNVPILINEDETMEFSDAIKWIDSFEDGEN